MAKLTDTQLVILNAAAGRDSHAVLPLPKSLKMNKGTATSVLKGLVAKKLLEERPAAPGAEPWRQDDDGRSLSLVISDAGLVALDGGPEAAPTKAAAKAKAAKKGGGSKAVPKRNQAADAGMGQKRPGGKVEQILGLLTRPEGACLTELEKATGWQPHSVRAALTGLRKRGIEITRERKDDVTTYYAKVA